MRSLRIRPVEGSRETFQYVKDSKYYDERLQVLEALPTLHSEQVSRVYRGVIPFLVVLAIAFIPLIYIGFIHNNATGYIIFIATLCLAYLIFSYWVHGYYGGTPPIPWLKQQPGLAKCPYCQSTTFRVELEAGSPRCSNCHSVLPDYIEKNR